MSKYLILATIWTLISAEIDYCAIKCKNGNKTTNHIVCEHGTDCKEPAYGCLNYQDAPLMPEERTLILDEHNHLRNVVALGMSNYSLKFIPAANMNELKWDDELEKIALCWVNTCGQYTKEPSGICFDTLKGKSGQSVAFKRISVPSHDLDSPKTLKEHIHGWFSEADGFSQKSLDAFPNRNNFQWKFRHFSQMVWAETSSIGCARSIYGQYMTMFGCIYRPAGNIVGEPVFKRGAACSECELGPCSEKYEGLCSVTEDVHITSSPTTTTTMDTTTTRGASTSAKSLSNVTFISSEPTEQTTDVTITTDIVPQVSKFEPRDLYTDIPHNNTTVANDFTQLLTKRNAANSAYLNKQNCVNNFVFFAAVMLLTFKENLT